MNELLYKGYTASLEVDVEEACIHGRIIGIPDVITFRAESPSAIVTEFRQAVEDFIEDCKAIGREVPKPCSGNVQFRINPSLHAAALIVAKDYGSFNKFGEQLLRKAVAERFPELAAA